MLLINQEQLEAFAQTPGLCPACREDALELLAAIKAPGIQVFKISFESDCPHNGGHHAVRAEN